MSTGWVESSAFVPSSLVSTTVQVLMLIEVDRLRMLTGGLEGAWVEQILEAMADRLTEWVGNSGWSRPMKDGRLLAMVFLDVDRTGSPDAAWALMRDLQQVLSQPLVVGSRPHTLPVSIGTVLGGDMPFLSTEEVDAIGDRLDLGSREIREMEPAPWYDLWLRNAQTALLYAQKHSRNQCAMFDPAVHQDLMERWELETALRQAIAQQELDVHYQPIVDSSSGITQGFEALCRWNHPERGWISPGEFIPLAEEAGLIIELGQWVLETACAQLKQWQNQGLVGPQARISINVASQQFEDPEFVSRVRWVLAQTELSPKCVSLEVLEGAFMGDNAGIVPVLVALRGLGVSISMDDFGTGFSSFSRLTKLPIDTLKIDRSFVEQMEQQGNDLAVIEMVIQLASKLGLTVIAEGASLQCHVEMLESLQCFLIQGFYYSRALSADQIPGWLAT